MFQIKNISVMLNDTSNVKDISLTIKSGDIHVLMGPNGSGKSSLAHALMGHPSYCITHGLVAINGENISNLKPYERARAGLLLLMQQPPALSGVKVSSFLQEAYTALHGPITFGEFYEQLITYMDILEIDYSFAYRAVNEGFSGGEKKKFAILEMLILKPKVVIIDEIDSGLDVDAIKIVARGIRYFQEMNPHSSLLLITHYQRIVTFFEVAKVYILIHGRIVASGDANLLTQIDKEGYDRFASQK